MNDQTRVHLTEARAQLQGLEHLLENMPFDQPLEKLTPDGLRALLRPVGEHLDSAIRHD